MLRSTRPQTGRSPPLRSWSRTWVASCSSWAAGRQPGRVVGEPAQVVRVQFPELRQLRAEGDARLAGVPFLPALPVLRVALYIEAVAWVEVDVPAQRTGIVVGERIGVVDVVGNLGKRRAVGVGCWFEPSLAASCHSRLWFGARLWLALRLKRLSGGRRAGRDRRGRGRSRRLPGRTATGGSRCLPGRCSGWRTSRGCRAGLRCISGACRATRRGPGDDVDHPHQCVGAVADGIRTAEHFDPLDILEGQRQVAPVDAGEARAVHRATVDQYLQAPRPDMLVPW